MALGFIKKIFSFGKDAQAPEPEAPAVEEIVVAESESEHVTRESAPALMPEPSDEPAPSSARPVDLDHGGGAEFIPEDMLDSRDDGLIAAELREQEVHGLGRGLRRVDQVVEHRDERVDRVEQEEPRDVARAELHGGRVALAAAFALGALQLEGLWEQLRGELAFSLLCGYRVDPRDERGAAALARACDVHHDTVTVT